MLRFDVTEPAIVRIDQAMDRPTAELRQTGPAPMSQNDRIERLLDRLASRLAPLSVIHGYFPNDGLRQPMAAGLTILDFVSWQVISPSQTFDLSGFQKAQEQSPLQSFVMVVDSIVTLELSPGAPGRVVMGPTVAEADISGLRRVTIRADVPYLLNLIAGTAPNQVDIRVFGFWQSRYHSSTLTKTAVAGTADSYAGLLFVPKEGTKQLTVATYGNANLLVQGYDQKTFVVRNTGSNAADFRCRGAIFADVATVTGLVDDPEILDFTLNGGESRVVETSYPWGLIQLQARANEAVAAAATTTVEVEFIGQQGGVR